MNRTELVLRSRNLVRDLSNSFFREGDVVNYLNEAIERVQQEIPELENMPLLTTSLQEATYLPKPWQHILAIYTASRLAHQDERFFQAGNLMNEFEVKLDSLKSLIQSGDIVIKDPDGNVIEASSQPQYVVNNYYFNNSGLFPRDNEDDWE